MHTGFIPSSERPPLHLSTFLKSVNLNIDELKSTDLASQRECTKQLFMLLRQETDLANQKELRGLLVQLHLPLVEYLARKFKDRGESYEDLAQVGTVGLLKAIDGFDLNRGLEFSTFATPTILGEIKRYFRDKGWMIKVPRRLQEVGSRLARATADFSQATGRSPTIAELSTILDLSAEEILEGLESNNAYTTISLDAPKKDEESFNINTFLGVEDAALSSIEYRESLRPLLDKLSKREKHILTLRFFQDKTQCEIAEELNLSQMQISRLLSIILEKLRTGLFETTSK